MQVNSKILVTIEIPAPPAGFVIGDKRSISKMEEWYFYRNHKWHSAVGYVYFRNPYVPLLYAYKS